MASSRGVILAALVAACAVGMCAAQGDLLACTMQKCGAQVGACLTIPECAAALNCVNSCPALAGNDTTAAVRCSNMCVLKNVYVNPFLAVMGCVQAACVAVPPPPKPTICSCPVPAVVDGTASPKSLYGKWTVMRGLNPVMQDCFYNHTKNFGRVKYDANKGLASFDVAFTTYYPAAVGGGHSTTTLPLYPISTGQFQAMWTLNGIQGYHKYHVLARKTFGAKKYAIIYYCSWDMSLGCHNGGYLLQEGVYSGAPAYTSVPTDVLSWWAASLAASSMDTPTGGAATKMWCTPRATI